jgi:hypothetical protein
MRPASRAAFIPGHPCALPSPILRRLSSTSQRRALPGSGALWRGSLGALGGAQEPCAQWGGGRWGMLGRAPAAGRRQKSIGKIKPPFTQSYLRASAHPLTPCSHRCPHLGSARPSCPLGTRLARTLPIVPHASGGPLLVATGPQEGGANKANTTTAVRLLLCLCCLGAAGQRCQPSRNRLSRGFLPVAPNGPPPSCAVCPQIGKTKGIFVRVSRKRAPCSDFHTVLDLFVSEASLTASCRKHLRQRPSLDNTLSRRLLSDSSGKLGL